MAASKNFISIHIDDDSITKSTSLWRKWKQTTSFQKKMFIGIICLLVLLLFVFSSRDYSPSYDVNQRKSHTKQKPKGKVELEEDAPKDLDDQIQLPILERLGKEKQQVLKSLEDRLQQDINRLQRLVYRGHPKFPAQHNKIDGDEDGSDQKVKMIPADLDYDKDKQIEKDPEVKKDYPLPPYQPLFHGEYNEQQKFIVNMYRHSWKGYKETAWGHDHSHPISRRYDDWFKVGLTILDSVDTSLIMGLEKEYIEARDWIVNSLTFNVNVDVNLFECTIRVLGSMLSAFHLTKDELYKDKAIDIGNRLLPAMTRSVSPIPFSDVNLKSANVHAPKWGPDSTVSEVTSIQLEFRDLSFITGDNKYKDAVDRITAHVQNLSGKKDGLVPMWINANTGLFRPGGTLTVGARADSYYEYLLKQWVQTNCTEPHFLNTYIEAVAGIKSHLVGKSVPSGFTYVGELLGGVTPSAKMDHLVCFLPGTLALGSTLIQNTNPDRAKEHMEFAKELLDTCYQMYAFTPTGLSPEIAYFNLHEGVKEDIILKPLDRHNLLRPETVESLFYMWRITKDKKYRDWGWNIALAFEKYSKVKTGGYTSIKNVMDPNKTNPMDKMESFFLGETLKYLFLLFTDDDSLISLDKWVLNTEAHPFPIMKSALAS